MQALDTIFYIIIVVMSVVMHEVSHGFMAEYFGDKTARFAGRLTLNPFRHLDWFGSVLLPAFMYFAFGFAFGWAKPVPYNPDNFRNKKVGTFWVAIAGILSNLFLALFFGMLLRFSFGVDVPEGFYFIVASIVTINLALALFNLVPIPPIDGSKILFSILPRSLYFVQEFLERYYFVLFLAFIFFFSKYLFPILVYLFELITGVPF